MVRVVSNKLPFAHFEFVAENLANLYAQSEEAREVLREEIIRTSMLLGEPRATGPGFLLAERIAFAHFAAQEAELRYAQAEADPETPVAVRNALSLHASRANNSYLRALRTIREVRRCGLPEEIMDRNAYQEAVQRHQLEADAMREFEKAFLSDERPSKRKKNDMPDPEEFPEDDDWESNT